VAKAKKQPKREKAKRLEKLPRTIAAKGQAWDAQAVAAAAGRKRHGKKKMAKKAAAGRKRKKG
jgi:hypothetical protein